MEKRYPFLLPFLCFFKIAAILLSGKSLQVGINGDKMHSSIDVANELLKKADQEKKSFTPMQLIKLVFLCHGWLLGLYGKHLIEEPIEAWRYGPVINSLYQAVREFKSSPVKYPLKSAKDCNFDNEEINVIDQVYKHYGNLSGIQLSSLTHEKDSPWDLTWSREGRYISNDLIEHYYKNLIKP